MGKKGQTSPTTTMIPLILGGKIQSQNNPTLNDVTFLIQENNRAINVQLRKSPMIKHTKELTLNITRLTLD